MKHRYLLFANYYAQIGSWRMAELFAKWAQECDV